eukprot:3611882-Alexandrium_andersonii.AAC.1
MRACAGARVSLRCASLRVRDAPRSSAIWRDRESRQAGRQSCASARMRDVDFPRFSKEVAATAHARGSQE